MCKKSFYQDKKVWKKCISTLQRLFKPLGFVNQAGRPAPEFVQMVIPPHGRAGPGFNKDT